MSIVTKTGDGGTTGLLYGRRISKTSLAIETIGCVDELSVALGAVRIAQIPKISHLISAPPAYYALSCLFIEQIQKHLIQIMGELSAHPDDYEKIGKGAFEVTEKKHIAALELFIGECEPSLPPLKGWDIPGTSSMQVACHQARVAARRVERMVLKLKEDKYCHNENIHIYFNRLSDAMWVLGRSF